MVKIAKMFMNKSQLVSNAVKDVRQHERHGGDRVRKREKGTGQQNCMEISYEKRRGEMKALM